MEKKKIYLYASISFAITSVLVYFLLKSKTFANVGSISTEFSKSSYNGLIVVKPNNKTKFEVLIVFGGMSYADPEWMYKQIPREVLLNYLVFIAPYTKSYTSVRDIVNSYMKSNGYDEKSLSLVGFSAGGLNVQSGYDRSMKFVGLIDPSTKSQYADIDFGKNTHMVYNNSNWGAYPNIKALQPKIANNISNGGGMVEEVNMSHASIPKYFFNSHSKYLL
jgi:hypothetical protein